MIYNTQPDLNLNWDFPPFYHDLCVIQGSEERENILQFKSQPEESLFIMIYE